MHVEEADLQNSTHKTSPVSNATRISIPASPPPARPPARLTAPAATPRWRKTSTTDAHGQAYLKKKTDAPYCTDCHGKHQVLSKRKMDSPRLSGEHPRLCGKCHGVKGKAARCRRSKGKRRRRLCNQRPRGRGCSKRVCSPPPRSAPIATTAISSWTIKIRALRSISRINPATCGPATRDLHQIREEHSQPHGQQVHGTAADLQGLPPPMKSR